MSFVLVVTLFMRNTSVFLRVYMREAPPDAGVIPESVVLARLFVTRATDPALFTAIFVRSEYVAPLFQFGVSGVPELPSQFPIIGVITRVSESSES